VRGEKRIERGAGDRVITIARVGWEKSLTHFAGSISG